MTAPSKAEWEQAPEAILRRGYEQLCEQHLEDAALVAISALPVRWAELARLRWMEGVARPQAAALLNLTTEQVRHMERKMRDILIDLLAREVL